MAKQVTDAMPVERPRQIANRSRMTPAEQSAEFERVAYDLGADQDEDAFKGVLRKLAKAKN